MCFHKCAEIKKKVGYVGGKYHFILQTFDSWLQQGNQSDFNSACSKMA